jgi:catechol 2,3-dioxygenase-like lactoylglutathione lyase family enzyme
MEVSGAPPKAGFSALAIELIVTDYARSLAFWTGPIGFTVCYTRPAQKFVYLEHPDGAQLMFYERDGFWETGSFEAPLGRGAILQIGVHNIDAAYAAVLAANVPVYVALRERWRHWGDREGLQREFLVQDPDGYLVMVNQKISTRTLPPETF